MKNKAFLFMFLLFTSSLIAQTDDKLIQKHFNLHKNVALSGYDAVSYFSGKPLEGNSNFSIISNGAVYLFANKENKESFVKSPEKYKPQFGGWCAYALAAKNDKVSVNPETFKIINGKLYLFYNAFFSNTLNSWNKDEKNFKIKAEDNWRKIFK